MVLERFGMVYNEFLVAYSNYSRSVVTIGVGMVLEWFGKQL